MFDSRQLVVLIVVFLCIGSVACAQLALKPPMGWSSWNTFRLIFKLPCTILHFIEVTNKDAALMRL
jgi:hypothetical protein